MYNAQSATVYSRVCYATLRSSLFTAVLRNSTTINYCWPLQQNYNQTWGWSNRPLYPSSLAKFMTAYHEIGEEFPYSLTVFPTPEVSQSIGCTWSNVHWIALIVGAYTRTDIQTEKIKRRNPQQCQVLLSSCVGGRRVTQVGRRFFEDSGFALDLKSSSELCEI